MKKLNEQSDRHASDSFLLPERLRILSPMNTNFRCGIFQFPSVIETSASIQIIKKLHQVPGRIKKTTTKHQFENVYFICSIYAHGIHSHIILSTVLTLMYFQSVQFVLSLHIRDSVCKGVTAETQTIEQTRNIVIHIVVHCISP